MKILTRLGGSADPGSSLPVLPLDGSTRPPPGASMISPRPALSPSFLAFRPSSPSASPPPSPRLHAPPPLSASFSSSTAVAAPDHATASSSFYDVLGLRPGASAREIKAAYRRLALAVHPDAAAPHPAASSTAEDFIRVHAAYSTLSDPDKRADYDRRLLLSAGRRRAQPVTLGRSPTFPARRSRRTWETDQCW